MKIYEYSSLRYTIENSNRQVSGCKEGRTVLWSRLLTCQRSILTRSKLNLIFAFDKRPFHLQQSYDQEKAKKVVRDVEWPPPSEYKLNYLRNHSRKVFLTLTFFAVCACVGLEPISELNYLGQTWWRFMEEKESKMWIQSIYSVTMWRKMISNAWM